MSKALESVSVLSGQKVVHCDVEKKDKHCNYDDVNYNNFPHQVVSFEKRAGDYESHLRSFWRELTCFD